MDLVDTWVQPEPGHKGWPLGVDGYLEALRTWGHVNANDVARPEYEAPRSSRRSRVFRVSRSISNPFANQLISQLPVSSVKLPSVVTQSGAICQALG